MELEAMVAPARSLEAALSEWCYGSRYLALVSWN